MKRLWSSIEQHESDTRHHDNKRAEVIDLAIAENWLIRPQLLTILKEVSLKDIVEKDLSYLNVFTGRFELVDKLSGFLNDYFLPSRRIERDHLAITAGASSALDVLLSAFCEPGEGVLVPAPYWNGFKVHFQLRAQVSVVSAEVDLLEEVFDTQKLMNALEVALTKSSLKVKALVLTNPHNPLGRCYKLDALERCLKFCEHHDLQLIFDEVYALSTFASPDTEASDTFISGLQLHAESLGCSSARIHMLWSTSKDFCASGLRIGCIVSQANQKIIHFASMRSSIHVSALSSVYLTSLLSSPLLPGLVSSNQHGLRTSYNKLTSFFSSYGIQYMPANAGLFVFAQLAPWAATGEDELKFLGRLKQFGVMASLGRDYNVPHGVMGWYRLTHAIKPDDLDVAILRLQKCIC